MTFIVSLTLAISTTVVLLAYSPEIRLALVDKLVILYANMKQAFRRYLVQRYGGIAFKEIAAATHSDRRNRHVPTKVIRQTLERHKAEIIEREGNAAAIEKIGEETPLERGEWWL